MQSNTSRVSADRIGTVAATRSRQVGLALGLVSLLMAGCAAPNVHDDAHSNAPSNASATNPTTRDVPQLLAAAEQEQGAGRHPQAANWYVQAALASSDEQVAETAARTCYENHQLKAAAQIAQRWLQINPTSQPARELAAMSALKLYRIDSAREQLQTLLESAYITPAAGFIELEPKLAAADANAATAVMKLLVERMPMVAEAHYVLAQLAAQTDNWGLMQSAAQRAHELAPYWSPAGLLLARAQLINGNPDQALQTAQSVVKNDDSLGTRSEYAGLLLASKRSNDALRLWRELEQEPGDNSAAVRALAQLDYEVGNYQSAFARFNRLLNTGKNLSESIFYLGSIAERTGANDEARQLYDRVQEGDFAAAAQVRVAGLIKNTDGLSAALNFLEAYGDANPEDMLMMLKARADLMADAGDQAGALALYDKAVKTYPDVADLHLSRAFQLVRMNKIKPALASMQQLLADRREDPTALNALGYTLVDRGHELQRGHDYIENALSYSPDSGAVLDSMGWAMFKLGRKSEALTYLQRAATRLVDADLDLHLGEVLWSLNQRDQALQVWQQSLKRVPDNKIMQQRLERATRGK